MLLLLTEACIRLAIFLTVCCFALIISTCCCTQTRSVHYQEEWMACYCSHGGLSGSAQLKITCGRMTSPLVIFLCFVALPPTMWQSHKISPFFFFPFFFLLHSESLCCRISIPLCSSWGKLKLCSWQSLSLHSYMVADVQESKEINCWLELWSVDQGVVLILWKMNLLSLMSIMQDAE